jgi:hypothetical protein
MVRMKLISGWSPNAVLAAIFASLTAGLAFAGWAELWPASPAPEILPLASAHIAAAESLLDGGARPSRAALARAEAEIGRALAEEPASAAAWLDLASVRRLEDGAYSPRVLDAVAKSYAVGPMDPAVSYWRLRFCFEDWTRLPDDLRGQVLREVDAVWSARDSREAMRNLPVRVRDPSGRVALDAEIARLTLDET